MNNTCKFSWGVNAILLVVIAAMAYMFIIRGSVSESEDGRTSIMLSAAERDLVLLEMRGFLEAVEAISIGLADEDLKAVAKAAHDVGMANAQGVPTALMGKLPLEFKTLGHATHAAFDDLSMEAQDMGDGQEVIRKLGTLLSNCTSCHATFRFDVEQGK